MLLPAITTLLNYSFPLFGILHFFIGQELIAAAHGTNDRIQASALFNGIRACSTLVSALPE